MGQDSRERGNSGPIFDIAPLSSADDRVSRSGSLFILGGGVAVLLLGLAVIVPALLQTPHDTISCARSGKCTTIPASQYYSTITVEAAITGGLAAVFLVIGALSRRARRPVAIRVSGLGLRFDYANGLPRNISWSSPSLSIALVDRSQRTPTGPVAPTVMFTAVVGGLRWLTGDLSLSKPAFDGILAAAKSAGVHIDESVSTGTRRSPAGTKLYVLRPPRPLRQCEIREGPPTDRPTGSTRRREPRPVRP